MVSRGVKVTIAGSMINFFIGTFYSWSVFADGLIHQLGWTRTEANLPYTVEVFVFAMMMVVAGRFQDRIGARKGAIISGLLLGTSFIFCALFPAPPGITFFFGIVFGTGAAFGYAAVTPAAMKWFAPQKRGLVTGFVVMSLGAGSLFWPPLINALIVTYGVVQTFFMWGLFLLAGVLVMAYFISEPLVAPADAGKEGVSAKLEWKKIASHPTFILLWLMMGLASGTGLMVVGHLVQIAEINFRVESGFLLISLFAFFNTGGRFSGGLITDRIGYRKVLFIAFLMILSSMLLFLGTDSWPGLLLGTILLGCSYGSLFTAFPAAIANIFGLNNFGAYYGMLFTALGIGGSLGPFLASSLAELYGSYNMAFALGIAASLLALALLFVLRKISS